jgi:hypothetical protein
MGYTIENKSEAVVQSVLLTTEKTFTSSNMPEKSSSTQANTQPTKEVYFQIED